MGVLYKELKDRYDAMVYIHNEDGLFVVYLFGLMILQIRLPLKRNSRIIVFGELK